MATNVPMYFCSFLAGITPDGPNVVLSFRAPEPSENHTSLAYVTNLRIVMPHHAVAQMADFLSQAKSRGEQIQEASHPMPETPQ